MGGWVPSFSVKSYYSPKATVRIPARIGYNALGLTWAPHPTSCLSHTSVPSHFKLCRRSFTREVDVSLEGNPSKEDTGRFHKQYGYKNNRRKSGHCKKNGREDNRR